MPASKKPAIAGTRDANADPDAASCLEEVGVWTVIASALFWSWFDLAVFRPSLFLPFGEAARCYGPFFVSALLCGAVPLLLAAVCPRRIEPLLLRKQAWVSTSIAAFVGGSATLIGTFADSQALIVLSGCVIGICCGCYQLLWARIYAMRGARSAVALVSLSIALGALVDFSIIGLPTNIGLFPVVLLPLVSLALMVVSPAIRISAGQTAYIGDRQGASGLGGSTNPDVSTLPRSNASRGQISAALDSIFEGSHHRILGLSLSLVFSFLIYGFSFGYDQYTSVFSDAELAFDPMASELLLVSRGLAALVVFFATQLLPMRIYTVFRVGILVGIAGCVLSPSIEALTGSSLLVGPVLAIGYATFDIITWTLLAEITHKTRVGVSPTIGTGRFLIHVSEGVGYLVVMGFLSSMPSDSLMQAFSSTLGYLMIIAEMLLLEENSALWILIRMNVSPATAETSSMPNKAGVDPQAAADTLSRLHGLTERESDVLRLLAVGRSRARIAQSLGVSENTVNSHVQQIYRKLGVHGRQELLDRLS